MATGLKVFLVVAVPAGVGSGLLLFLWHRPTAVPSPSFPADAGQQVTRIEPRGAAGPVCLALTLSDDPKTPLPTQLDELQALSQTPCNAAALEPLRSLIHQPQKNETLRNEAGKVLLAWNLDWYVTDLIEMMQDPRQSDVWRNYCVQHLAEHYLRYADAPSLRGLEQAAAAQDYVIRSQAVFSLANIAKERDWRTTSPRRLYELSALLKSLLSEAAKLPSPVQSASLHGDPVKAPTKPAAPVCCLARQSQGIWALPNGREPAVPGSEGKWAA